MAFRSFLRQELWASARRGDVFRHRTIAAVTAAISVAAYALAWERRGWDRTSVSGAAAFALRAFELIVAVLALLAFADIPERVARRIPSERERKTLDALLATPLSGAAIVLGSMAAGSMRFLTGVAAIVPVVSLLGFLGGVDPRLVLLSAACLASTAFALASLSAVAATSARTARRGISFAVVLELAWIAVPLPVLLIVPRFWPAVAAWLSPVAALLAQSSPFGPIATQLGLFAGVGGPVETWLRMIAYQAVVGTALTTWAIIRLRPASRALDEAEGRRSVLRALRKTRWRPRPSCGDDPVLWNEIHAVHGTPALARFVGRASGLVALVVLCSGVFAYAVPAFVELRERGYGPAPEAFVMPQFNPFARLLVSRFIPSTSAQAATGQARLELNIVVRQLSAALVMLFIVTALGTASESVESERRRDTWLGLLATPLTGWEIVRAKMLASVIRARAVVLLLIALWIVGLLAGALHPLALLAGLVDLVALGGLYAALGVALVISPPDPARALNPLLVPLQLVGIVFVVMILIVTPVVLFVIGMVSYEDVHAAVHAGIFPQFEWPAMESPIRPAARVVVGCWLLGTTAVGYSAVRLTRSLVRRFDALVGRPVRPVRSR